METTAEYADTLNESELLDEEREPLFPNQDEPVFVNSMHVTRGIHTIRYLERLIDQYQNQLDEAIYFYSDRKSRSQERIEFIKRSLLAFLHQNDMKNIQTPSGTAYQKEVTMKVWPPSEELVSWALAHIPTAIRTKHEPDKKMISEYVRANGEVPAGYEEVTETRLYIK